MPRRIILALTASMAFASLPGAALAATAHNSRAALHCPFHPRWSQMHFVMGCTGSS